MDEAVSEAITLGLTSFVKEATLGLTSLGLTSTVKGATRLSSMIAPVVDLKSRRSKERAAPRAEDRLTNRRMQSISTFDNHKQWLLPTGEKVLKMVMDSASLIWAGAGKKTS